MTWTSALNPTRIGSHARRRAFAQRAQRRSCRLQDLDGADKADRVLKVDPGVRIDGEQHLAQRVAVELVQLRA